MKRRSFLKAAAAGAGAAAVGWPGLASAAWGDITTSSFWPAGVNPAQKVLEIHLWGGMAPWESFYFRPDPPDKTRGFDADVSALLWNAGCPNPPSGLASQALANDSNGKPVHLGPFAKPLWRSDIRSRMRVLVLGHDLAPHEAAIPYSLAGHRLGRPNFSGLGAPLQRRGRELSGGSHPLPFSYCLVPPLAVSVPYFAAMDATGGHPGDSKPIVVTTGAGTAAFVANLDRSTFAPGNALIDQYRQQYRRWLIAPGKTAPVRSIAYQDYAASVDSLFLAPQLSTLMAGAPLTTSPTAYCSREPSAPFDTGSDFSAAAIRAAAYLLTRPAAQQARYVLVVDGGMQNQGFAYDVHSAPGAPQVRETSSHLWSLLSALESVIRDPANPTPADSEKLSLDDTLIVIKTEFGRTPYRSLGGVPCPPGIPATPASPGMPCPPNTSNGRDHWPEGYVNVLIGGPISTAGVVGSIADGGPSGDQGKAEVGHRYKPEDVQCAALLAAGIDPFADGNFQQGELTPSLQGGDHDATRVNLRQTLLGVV